nr:fibrinogen C domain-containing protein 1-like [Biomphalaria glabrata]
MRSTSQLAFLKFSFLIAISFGARISFVANSEDVKELIRPLELTCSFQELNGTIPNLIYILKDGSTVIAKISQEIKKGKNLNSTSNVVIESNIFQPKTPFLKITWKRPTGDNSGQYVCFIHARNAMGVDSLYQSPLNVTVKNATFQDLLEFSLKQAALLEEKGSLIVNLDSRLKRQNRQMVKLGNEMTAAKAEINKLRPNVQEGAVQCPNSNTFKHTPSPDDEKHCLPTRQSSHYVRFSKPYERTPSIKLSLMSMGLSKDFHTRFYYFKRNVSTEGFEIVCHTWCDTYIDFMTVSWLAINN